MFRAIAAFELSRHVRGQVFWVVSAISFGLVLGSVGTDALRVGVHPDGLRNGAEAIVLTYDVWTLFFMFTTAAFVADAVLRDELVGFAAIFAALPVRRTDYLYGRFAGVFAAVLLCFLSVPLGMVAGAVMPWVTPASVGPLQPIALAYAYLVIAVPNLLLSASVGFALATASRSMGMTLVGAVALLTAYGAGTRMGAVLPPMLEPFGFAAYGRSIVRWSAAERDVYVPALHGVLLGNRLLVLSVAAGFLLLASARFPERRQPPRSGADRQPAYDPRHSPEASRRSPVFDRWTLFRQLAIRTRLEVAQIVQTPVFVVLMLLGVANALGTLGPMQHPSALAVAHALGGAFQLAPLVIALFFSGELRWSEQERGIGAILFATPIAPAAFLLPKFVALTLVLIGAFATAAVAAVALLAGKGDPAAAWLLPDWLMSGCYDALTFAALALFLQAIAPNKLAGWGFTILYLIANLALDRLGLTNAAYRYGRYPGYPWPGSISGARDVGAYRLLWAALATILLAMATRFAHRRRLHR